MLMLFLDMDGMRATCEVVDNFRFIPSAFT